MAYTIQIAGSDPVVVNDGTINGSTGVQLPGRNFAGYGQYMNQNLIDLLQNFSRISTVPANGVQGQIWFKADSAQLFIKSSTPTANSVATPAGWKKILIDGDALGSVTSDTLNTKNITTGGATVEGTITGKWSLTGGSTLHATYADLAERFEADNAYEPGTVVELGGEKEITAVKDDCSENVFGVVSSNAAYLMNSAAGDNSTHPAIAIAGRVPVKVRGQVKKGDRLVSAGSGYARAARRGEATSFNTVGRALENKHTDIDGSVLATVTAKM